MMSDTVSMVERPYFCAMAAEMVYSPELYSRRTNTRPNSRKPMDAPITDHDAANPLVNASCAVPTVDFAPTNSDISRIPTTDAGRAREAVMNCALVRLRSRTVSQLVNRM